MRTMLARGVIVLMAALAPIAVACATAAAELPEVSGGKGIKFTEVTGKVTMEQEGGASISCKKSSQAGEFANAKEGTDLLKLEGCTSSGLSTNSSGDAAGVILIKTDILLCYINAPAKDVGVLFTVLPTTGVKLEIPSVSLTFEVKDRFVALITPVNTLTKNYVLLLQQESGKQKIEKCEGNTNGAEVLLWKTDAGTFRDAGIEFKESKWTDEVNSEILA
jgi:hypothetical protein